MNDAVYALQADAVTRSYRQGEADIVVLKNLCLQIAEGEKVAIIGRSGSGKSTLLHVLAGLDSPQRGSVLVDGVDMASADNDTRAAVRARAMGFVYQNHHLLPEFNALENVAMPLRIRGQAHRQCEQQAHQLLSEVGLAARVSHLPSQLSGGERQRVAVARAMAGEPRIILADEPTGNLDRENARQVMSLLSAMSERHGTALMVVTHDPGMLGWFDRVMLLKQHSLEQVAADDIEGFFP